MKKTVLLVVVTFSLWSCGASQPARVYGNKNISNNNSYSYNTLQLTLCQVHIIHIINI